MSWYQDTLFDLVKAGGSQVSEEIYEQRLAACLTCPYFSTVNPLPGIEAMGCTLCGCPIETKGRMNEYFSVSKMKMVKAECTLVEKGQTSKWPSINNKK